MTCPCNLAGKKAAVAKKKSSSRGGSSARRFEPKCPAKYSLAAVNPMTGKRYKRPVCVRAAARKGKAGVKLKTTKPRRGAEIMPTGCRAGKLVKFNPNTGKALKRPMCATALKSGRAKLAKPVHQSVKVRKIIAVSGRR